MALAGSAAWAQRQMPEGRQQQQRQQMQRMGALDSLIEDHIELRLARSVSLSGTDVVVKVEDRVAALIARSAVSRNKSGLLSWRAGLGVGRTSRPT